jgi:hypothetical protein
MQSVARDHVGGAIPFLVPDDQYRRATVPFRRDKTKPLRLPRSSPISTAVTDEGVDI